MRIKDNKKYNPMNFLLVSTVFMLLIFMAFSLVSNASSQYQSQEELFVEEVLGEDFVLEKIASINILQPQQVYDLSIENTHNFIANDIIAHNTGEFARYIQ